ncbi:unnamed protein product [Schistocephalus solidus]|uniref:SEA domain-containing protein n=1 Tax=Schistocephalus solidus TaxID=70667 RepID=A0A183SQJ8_SCHSO|nr:unnamed protein product [Schistocephalus solidus]
MDNKSTILEIDTTSNESTITETPDLGYSTNAAYEMNNMTDVSPIWDSATSDFSSIRTSDGVNMESESTMSEIETTSDESTFTETPDLGYSTDTAEEMTNMTHASPMLDSFTTDFTYLPSSDGSILDNVSPMEELGTTLGESRELEEEEAYIKHSLSFFPYSPRSDSDDFHALDESSSHQFHCFHNFREHIHWCWDDDDHHCHVHTDDNGINYYDTSIRAPRLADGVFEGQIPANACIAYKVSSLLLTPLVLTKQYTCYGNVLDADGSLKPWVADYSDLSNQLASALAQLVCELLVALLRLGSNFAFRDATITCIVVEFYEGSVVAEAQVSVTFPAGYTSLNDTSSSAFMQQVTQGSQATYANGTSPTPVFELSTLNVTDIICEPSSQDPEGSSASPMDSLNTSYDL